MPSGASERTLRLRATASSETPSMSSMAAGTTRSRMISATALTAASTVRNVARSVACSGRLRHQPQDDLRDDGERPLGPDQQVRQVVADDVLDDLPAGLDDLAGRQHRLEAQHVLLGRPVLERARPAGALGDVAADDRLPQRRRVRRIEEPDLLDRVLEIAGDDVGFDDGDEVGFVDLEDAVHPLERDHDAAARRDRAAGVAGAAAARHHRDPVLRAEAHDRRDLRGRCREARRCRRDARA